VNQSGRNINQDVEFLTSKTKGGRNFRLPLLGWHTATRSALGPVLALKETVDFSGDSVEKITANARRAVGLDLQLSPSNNLISPYYLKALNTE
jgi:hypothetical protein